MYSEIEKENKLFIRKKIFVDGVSIRFLDGLLDTLDEPQYLDAVEEMLINEEKNAVKNQSLLDIMIARNVSLRDRICIL